MLKGYEDQIGREKELREECGVVLCTITSLRNAVCAMERPLDQPSSRWHTRCRIEQVCSVAYHQDAENGSCQRERELPLYNRTYRMTRWVGWIARSWTVGSFPAVGATEAEKYHDFCRVWDVSDEFVRNCESEVGMLFRRSFGTTFVLGCVYSSCACSRAVLITGDIGALAALFLSFLFLFVPFLSFSSILCCFPVAAPKKSPTMPDHATKATSRAFSTPRNAALTPYVEGSSSSRALKASDAEIRLGMYLNIRGGGGFRVWKKTNVGLPRASKVKVNQNWLLRVVA